ncbi:MAG: molecular chaperone TorD family protein [Rhodocyclales bacterium]|nr:molecular chaperone TorD family protein [Rhodocyclales bacterium]
MTPHTQLWLALSRAFLPPTDREVATALLESLPGELEELCEAVGVDALPDIGALAESLDLLGTADALLVHFSGLFLPPSARASLNIAIHLDGSLNGSAMDAIEDAMTRHGVGKAEGFHDMPDHLAVLLEVLALIAAEKVSPQETAEFARAFLLPALPRLEAQIAENEDDSPWLHLVRIAQATLAPYALPEERNRRRERAEKRADTELGVWRACKTCGKPYAREKELQIMAKALQVQGLPSAHLDLCMDCRAPGGNWLSRSQASAAPEIND